MSVNFSIVTNSNNYTVSVPVLQGMMCFFDMVFLNAVSSFASGTTDSTGFLSDSTRSNVNLFFQMLYVIGWLIVVLVLLVFALWVLKKVLKLKGGPVIAGGSIQILEIKHLDQKKSIALVKVLDRVLVVGCTDSSLSGLGELSAEEISRLKVEEPADAGVFDTVLSRFTGKNRPAQNKSGSEKA